jgi:sec-independent protein translocase protein TatC
MAVSTTKNPGKVMPVMEHLRELRDCILVSLVAFVACCIVAFIFSDRIISLFTRQFDAVMSAVGKQLVVSNIVEGFVVQMKVSVIAGFIISLPIHIFNVLRFVFPGLTGRQKRVILAYLLASLGLIVLGAYIAYFKIVPLAIAFLTDPYFVPKGVGYLLNYQDDIFYVFSFILWSVVTLQTPLVLELLLQMNVLKRRQVFAASRYVIVGIFIVAAIITPPDFISQLGVALPLTLCYFLALLIAKICKFGEG